MYIELHAASAFSFLQGASLPETLIERAADLGYPALALLDADGVYGAPRFHKAAAKAGLRAIIGAELTIEATGGAARTAPHRWRLPVLVASAEGYRHLCRLVTKMKLRAAKGEGALQVEELDGCTSGLVALPGRALLDAQHYGVGGLLDRLVGIFGRGSLHVDVQRHLLRDEESDNAALAQLAQAYRVPLAATNGVRFATPGDRQLFDVLTCIHHHTSLDAAGRRLARNAERYLKSPEAMAQLFGDWPDALRGTEALAERLEYTMADLGYQFPKYPVPPGETEMSFLRHITEVGARDRFRPYHDKARRQIDYELALIEKLDLAGYFLIVWDIVSYCRQHDILVQGRGSAANSAVCYSLGITAIDPIQMELLFERFLSEERGEWPDIDLDLPSGDRREQVIQHVYQKYGRLGAAMTANVITYRGRSAAREVGKALALDAGQIDRLAKVMHHFEYRDPHETLARNLETVGLSIDQPRIKTFAELWRQMQDLPRHLGQHSGGMVVSQGALDSVVPLEPASMPGRVVIQWDKDDCADMGIVKVDLLGLGMMAVLQDALSLINTTRLAAAATETATPDAPARGKPVEDRTQLLDLAGIPGDDPAVYEMLQQADTIGVFQVESRAQMATLPRMKPEKFYDLVVEVAIIRPGPIVGQMVHPYLNRRAGREAVVPLHPSLEPVLARTLGVPLFQEQLLRMAMVAANFTGGQAEDLRRAMGFKRSEKRMKQIEVQLRAGMAQNGITGETAETIITSITSFALYGFPESHAASFALLAYASAYLKVHYPSAFYTALLNNQPMGFYHPATLVKDAQRRGVRFHPIDVQQSDWPCRVEEDGGIRLGLQYVSGLRKDMGQAMAAFDRTKTTAGPAQNTDHAQYLANRLDAGSRLLCAKCGSDDDSMIEVVSESARKARTYFCNICSHEWTVKLEPVGRFESIEQLVQRTGLRRDELATLADIGALNAFTHDRRSALWQVERAVRPAGELFKEGEQEQGMARSIDEGLPDVERQRSGGSRSANWVAKDDQAQFAPGIPADRRHGGVEQAAWPPDGDGDGQRSSRPGGALPPAGHRLREGEQATRPGQQVPAAPIRYDLWKPGLFPPDAESSTSSEATQAPEQLVARDAASSPLPPMNAIDRLQADYAGTGLTIGPHPMSLHRGTLALRGVLRAIDLVQARDGRRVRVAGMVITRQRPGTAKGFVFLTLEDETGISNVIIRPDLFDRQRTEAVRIPFLLVDGIMQQQDGVRSVKAERLEALDKLTASVDAHDFY